MADETDEKFPKKSVSFPQTMLEYAEGRARDEFGGNFSRYIQTAVERERTGQPGGGSTADIIIGLAKAYAPTLAAELKAQLAQGPKNRPINQPRVIARFLEALHEALTSDLDPEAKFELADKKRIQAWEKESASRMATLANEVAEALARRQENQTYGLNEAAPPRIKKKSSGMREPGSNPPVPAVGGG